MHRAVSEHLLDPRGPGPGSRQQQAAKRHDVFPRYLDGTASKQSVNRTGSGGGGFRPEQNAVDISTVEGFYHRFGPVEPDGDERTYARRNIGGGAARERVWPAGDPDPHSLHSPRHSPVSTISGCACSVNWAKPSSWSCVRIDSRQWVPKFIIAIFQTAPI